MDMREKILLLASLQIALDHEGVREYITGLENGLDLYQIFIDGVTQRQAELLGAPSEFVTNMQAKLDAVDAQLDTLITKASSVRPQTSPTGFQPAEYPTVARPSSNRRGGEFDMPPERRKD